MLNIFSLSMVRFPIVTVLESEMLQADVVTYAWAKCPPELVLYRGDPLVQLYKF